MGDLYASAIGTTILQLKEIPPCPLEFKGALYVGMVAVGVDEAKLKDVLSDFGPLAEGGCSLHAQPELRREGGAAQLAGAPQGANSSCVACGKTLSAHESEWAARSYAVSCDECYDASRCRYAIVRFTSHASAEQAAQANASTLGVGEFFTLHYNELEYDHRGWWVLIHSTDANLA
jgi:hypothetical protein